MDIPELVLPGAPEATGDGFTVGLPRLRYRGADLDLPTVGEWRVKFGDRDLATVTVTIPVRTTTDPLDK